MIHISRLRAVLGVGAMAVFTSCGGDGGSEPTPDFSLTVDQPAATTLGTQNIVRVHLTSTGTSGAVAFDVTGEPASWTVTPPAGLVTLPANGQVTADLTVSVPSNGDTTAVAGRTLTIAVTIGTQTHSAQALVTVANMFIAALQRGGNSTTGHWGSLALTTIHLNVGTLLRFRNDDTTAHNIHANSQIPGLDHQNVGGPGTPPGGFYDQRLTGVGNDQAYCHSHSATTDYITFVVP